MPETDSAKHPHLYRAIRKHRWYDKVNRQVLSVAFEYRASDQGTLSVLKSVNRSREHCYAGLNECYGEFVLATDRVKALGLEVLDDEPDAENYSENHASIIGIPVHPENDEELKRAEDLRTHLASLSTLNYDRYGRYT